MVSSDATHAWLYYAGVAALLSAFAVDGSTLNAPSRSSSALPRMCAGVAESVLQRPIEDLRVMEASVQDSVSVAPDVGEDRESQHLCRIRGVMEKEIGFELWLPAPERWNGKFMGVGVGGEAGVLNFRDMSRALGRGYATASTDTGHSADDAFWAWRRPDRQANFASRANHLLAVGAKTLISRFYGHSASYAYFVGCSGGGREGLKEAQSYPADYDGVLAGGAGPDQFSASMRLLWMQYVMEPTHRGLMDAGDWNLVADQTVATCDRTDGVLDGVIEDPRACRFDIASLRCAAGNTAGCLSEAQVAYAKKMFAPLRDEQGVAIDQGLVPGVPMRFEPRSRFALTLFGLVTHDDPAWDPTTVNIALDLAAARRAWPDLPNDNSDLRPFQSRGGKLIYYHGWLDPFLPALSTLAYHEKVKKRLGVATDDVMKVFMVPGLGHCNGGSGPDQFGGVGQGHANATPDNDMLSALEAWVERGRSPERIVASKIVGGKRVRTRPLCAVPTVAIHDGMGSTDSAESFLCKKP